MKKSIKNHLINLIKTNPKIALAFYMANFDYFNKKVEYNSEFDGLNIIRYLTIDNKEYEVEREELKI